MRMGLFFLLFGFTKTAFSQTDSLLPEANYGSRIADKASEPVFNGPMHVGYPSDIEGVPYYSSNAWQKGMLVYQHIPYKEIYLKYDLVADEVIVRHLNGITGVILFTPRIESFSLGDRFFLYLPANEESGLKAGIYEQVIKGKLSLYVKRSRLIVENIVANTLEKKFVNNDKLYALKEGHYHLIKKPKDIIQLLDEKKGEVHSHLKSSGIRYKFNHELAIARMVEYYNQLSK